MRKYLNWPRMYRYSYRRIGLVYYTFCHLLIGALFIYFYLSGNLVMSTLFALCSVVLWLRLIRPGRWNEHLPTRQNYLASISTTPRIQPVKLIGHVNYFEQRPVACADGGVWRYTDFRYSVYRLFLWRGIVAEYRYFSAVQISLPRDLPAMLFLGSHKGHGHKSRYDKGHKTSLEGNFDDYFETYFPYHYHIDARSIISPEVMIEMLEMKDCDIEIMGNAMIFYFYPPKMQDIHTYINRALLVRAKLVDHIVHYRDERLGKPFDRINISAHGWSLRESGLYLLCTSIFFAIIVVVLLWWGWDDYSQTRSLSALNDLLEPASMPALISIFTFGFYVDNIIDNRKARKRPPRQ